jgi:hypothetical protein
MDGNIMLAYHKIIVPNAYQLKKILIVNNERKKKTLHKNTREKKSKYSTIFQKNCFYLLYSNSKDACKLYHLMINSQTLY